MTLKIEEQLIALETAVHKLETESVDLETAMATYSTSVQQLAKILKELNEAEKKLFILKEDAEKLFEEPQE